MYFQSFRTHGILHVRGQAQVAGRDFIKLLSIPEGPSSKEKCFSPPTWKEQIIGVPIWRIFWKISGRKKYLSIGSKDFDSIFEGKTIFSLRKKHLSCGKNCLLIWRPLGGFGKEQLCLLQVGWFFGGLSEEN